MAQAIASRPLASLALPESGTTRLFAQAAIALGGTLLLTVSAKTSVPFWPVPMTLQTLAVLMIGAAFGMRLGVATVLLYLAEGAAGLPIFQATPEKGIGLAYMMGPTGGYLLGFVALAAIAGWAADRGWDRDPAKMLGAMLTGECAMMLLGFTWLSVLIGIEKAWQFGVMPFVAGDLVKVALAAAVIPAVWSLLGMLRPR